MGGSESRDIGRDGDEEDGESSNQRNTGVGTALAVGAAVGAVGLLAWGASRAATDSSDHQQREDNNNIVTHEGSHGNIASGSADRIQYRWIKPAHGRFKLNSDGSFNGSKSGIGGLIRNSQGELILAYGEPCSTADDIVEIEFLAVLKGLQYAVDQKIQYIDIETDNDSVARILSTKESPQKYHNLLISAKPLLNNFRSVLIADVPREVNSCADLMVKIAVRDQKVIYWAAGDTRIPEALHTRIRNDFNEVYTRKI